MSFDSREILDQLLSGHDLNEAGAAALMRALAMDDMAPARAGALLAALRAKGETPDEIRGFAKTMRELALPTKIPVGLQAVDSVGTGGDGSNSVNISTGAALVAAASGIPMVKHGNRSVSSQSGSADVLEALGIVLPPTPEVAMEMLEQCGFTFLFAPFFHPAMKAIGPVRAAMGVRTLFNILGPLTNPAAPPFHVIGAYSMPVAEAMADTLAGMELERAFVIHGKPGWDEASPVGYFELFDVTPGRVRRERRDPKTYGIPRCEPEDLVGGDAEFNARALEAVLTGAEQGPHRDALVLGAGLVLEVSGQAQNLQEGIDKVRCAIDSGAGTKLLASLRAFKL